MTQGRGMTASTDRAGIVHGHRRAAGRQGHDLRHRKSAGYDELPDPGCTTPTVSSRTGLEQAGEL